jgi:hypothetical protein
MTTLATRTDTRPAVIDGEVVYTHADQVPPRNPHRFAARASALILLTDAIAGLLVLDGSDGQKGAWVVSLLVAVAIYVFCLVRFNTRAGVGDR